MAACDAPWHHARTIRSILGAAALFALVATLALVRSGYAQSDGPCNAAPLPITGTRIVNVSTEPQLQSAVANAQVGDTIVLADGVYTLTSSLYLNNKNNVTIRGTDGCDGATLVGKGMDNPNYGAVPFGVWSNSLNTTVAHLTIRDTYDNILIFNAGAQSPHIYSVRLLNAGSQFVKANPTDATNGVGVDSGVLEYSWLEYTAGPPATDHGAGFGYTNGISAHAADGWIIRKNMFKNFHTPDSDAYLWNPAVLMWNHSSNTLTEQNTFINVDRAIAYGLVEQATGFDHQGGTIRNNFVYMAPGLYSASRTAGSDGQIIVWDSPDSVVYHNTLLTNGNVLYSIQFRFVETTGGEARNNLADAPISLRDGATAAQSGNLTSATSGMFVNPAAADLHLLATATAAIDKAPTLAAVTNDFDGDARPQGTGYDIGADEFRPSSPPPQIPTTLSISAPTVTAPANASIGVTVAATSGTPTGTVSLSVDGGAPLAAALSAGHVSFTLTSPSAGVHALAGSYAAQSGFGASAATGSLTVSPSGAVTTVDFDNPAPPGAPGSKLGTFGGISWGRSWCWWPPVPGLDATNHANFCRAGVTSRTFSFSPGPKRLASISLVSSVAGTATIRDNNGQQIAVALSAGQTATVTTGWTKASTRVTVSSSASVKMGVTALTYD
jgi:hypothetical protein